MAKCDECGSYENLPYQCRRCGQTFCADHRLPENHDCPGLDGWNDPQGVFATHEPESEPSALDRVSSRAGGLTGYFRGNATYLFLGLMWVTFFLQFAVLPLLGVPPGYGLWADLFVLTSAHPEFVWTWVTSVFAHGGFGHIAANSIVLYFFGPPVERRLGTRRFAALFLLSGMAAGLLQIGTNIFLFGSAAGVLGASGAIMAVMGVLTVLNPNLKVYLYFIIPMPLWVLTFGFALLSVFAGFGSFGGNIAHFAHLTGLVIGLAYGSRVKGEGRPPQQLRLGGGGGRRGGGPRGPF